MKLRIIREGEKFFVQKKRLFWWVYEEDVFYGSFGDCIELIKAFDTVNDARERIKKICEDATKNIEIIEEVEI